MRPAVEVRDALYITVLLLRVKSASDTREACRHRARLRVEFQKLGRSENGYARDLVERVLGRLIF
jgi:hypothetical protein